MDFVVKKTSFEVEGSRLAATVYLPGLENKKKTPGVLIVHGWGSRQARFVDRAEALAGAGIVCMTFSMRGREGSDGKLKDQTIGSGFEDLNKAFEVFYGLDGLDRMRIGLYGGSYGAYLIALLLEKQEVKSVLLEVPAIYRDEWWQVNAKSYSRKEHDECRQEKNLSGNRAMKIWRGFEGSALLVEHERDESVPKVLVQNYFENLKSAKQKEYRTIKSAEHRLVDQDLRDESNLITKEWFIKTL